MTSALIGSTGFVGGSLLRQTHFDAAYHSTDVHEMCGRHFDLVVCAGAPAAKWKANKEPDADLANTHQLIKVLDTVHADRFILISTVDVYGSPVGVTEDTPVEMASATAYGRHRRLLEEFVQRKCAQTTVLRLPGLFGLGLRKNVIFDLLHGNNVEQIHPEGVFQYYNADQLWQDVTRTLEHDLPLVHLSSEPVRTRDLAKRCFGVELAARPAPAPAAYDLRSKYAALWGGHDGYLFDREEILSGIESFVRVSRAGLS
jgi:nucleoside-diphosphate-sugar epimerase